LIEETVNLYCVFCYFWYNSLDSYSLQISTAFARIIDNIQR